jgi:hypothetical protein
MGVMVKTVLDDVLTDDLLQLLKTEAKLTKNKVQAPQTAKPGTPLVRRRVNRFPKENYSFQLPPRDMLLRPRNIDIAKTRPVMTGGLLVLGLRSPYVDRRLNFLTSKQMFQLEEDLLFTLVDNGAFDGPQPEEVQTPFGIMLGLPMSYN